MLEYKVKLPEATTSLKRPYIPETNLVSKLERFEGKLVFARH